MIKYLRWLGFGLLFGILFLLGFVFYPFIYSSWDAIYLNNSQQYGETDEEYASRKKTFWWYMINGDEPDLLQNKYGADWWRERKGIRLDTKLQRFWAYYRWITRNPHYNLKLHWVPKVGDYQAIKIYWNTTIRNGLTWCNKSIVGWQFSTFTKNYQRQFRMSATFKLLWWVQNFQFGYSDNRYIYKIRFWSRKEINFNN